MKICFLAPSGYGKSTAIQLLQKNFKILNIKIAKPLYDLQEIFYNKIGIDIKMEQDGELLQFLGLKIRKENPSYLLLKFQEQIKQCESLENIIITNDDCRTYDYQCLKDLGFIFIKINGYSRNRNDLTPINKELKLEWKSDIPFDYEINNYKDLDTYEKELLKIMEVIINDREMLCHSYSKSM
ncbi:MAG: hypothetical protein RSE91_04135 [Bacilli bacterium]